MKENRILEKTVRFAGEITRLRIPLYAANASFFIILAAFPALLLLLGLLQYTPLEPERLEEILAGLVPDALLKDAGKLIRAAWNSTSRTSLSVSAVAAAWSAGKGVHGIMTGLNAVYGLEEDRGYLRTRLLSGMYTVVLLVVLVLTLGLNVFGIKLLSLMKRLPVPLLSFLAEVLNFRFFLLLAVQTGVFTAMFMALPNGKSRFRESFPGAVLASFGWLAFSGLFSIYVEHFATLSDVYGSVYAIALSMLWLYCCMAIVLCGGAWNRYLRGR